MRIMRLTSLLLALSLLAGVSAEAVPAAALPAAASAQAASVQAAPGPQAVVIPDAASLAGIVAASLPERGRLTVGGRTLLRGEGVAREELDCLVWYPDAPGGDRFSYWPVDADGQVGALRTAELTAAENRVPVARTVQAETYRNLPAAGAVGATDPDGGALRYTVTREPEMGVVELDEETGRFVYTPYLNRTGTDRFCYAALDAQGGRSAEAEVTVKVSKPQTQLTYADMRDSTAAYAAVRLAELGICEGPRIGGVSYFEPDRPMTRAELIAMAVALTGEEPSPVSRTGYADDDAIPVWARSFAAAAQRTGVAAGQSGPDGVILRADEPVTRAEAAVILCAAAGLGDAVPTGELADAEAIPAWAAADAVSASELGLLDTADGRFDASAVLTRAEGARAVYRAWELMQKAAVRTGFFSWVL